MIKHIAIKGNAEKGHEIINLLEMMGGKNVEYYTGRDSGLYYFIDDHTKYISNEVVEIMEYGERDSYILFSLSCFKDDYPWVVGDVVDVMGRENKTGLKIVKMQWGDAYNTMMYCLDCGEDGYGWWRAEDLKYNNLNDDVDMNVEFDLSKYSYEVKDEKLIIKEKKPKYPKTFKECRAILDNYITSSISGYRAPLLTSLHNLLVCLDAYWKIAGEEMGLDGPWEPRDAKDKYIIRRAGDTIIKGYNISSILEFPTPEMRDAFYENFKDLIEKCYNLI